MIVETKITYLNIIKKSTKLAIFFYSGYMGLDTLVWSVDVEEQQQKKVSEAYRYLSNNHYISI